MKSDTKWWKDKIPASERGWDMRFLFERRDANKIAKWTQEQKESAIRNLREMKHYFDGFYEETMKLLGVYNTAWVKIQPGCEMPAKNETVLIFHKHHSKITARYGDRNYTYGLDVDNLWFWRDGNKQYSRKYITHWAPLPANPKL